MENMQTYDVVHLPEVITIGRQTETGVMDIRIDCLGWKVYWPTLSISLWVTPPGGWASYEASTYMDGNTLVWKVNASDTAVEGFGTMEVVGIAPGQKKLSSIAKTRVLHTTTVDTSDPPEAFESWMDKLNTVVSEAEAATDKANNAVGPVGPKGEKGDKGDTGPYYIPHVSANGDLTWDSSDDSLPSVGSLVNLKGEMGEPGKNGVGIVSMKQTTQSSEDGGVNTMTFTLSDGKTSGFSVKNGSTGDPGPTGPQGPKGDTGPTGPAYTLTASDKTSIASEVKASLASETWVFTLANGSTVSKVVPLL